MPNLEWDVPHAIQSPYGTLDLNVADPDTGRIYLVVSDGYQIVPTLRVTQDNISQTDGSVLHPRWKTGLVATLKLLYFVRYDPDSIEGAPACAADLREMDDLLGLHLNAIRQLTTINQRLLWTPTGYGDQRMLDDVQLLSWPAPTFDLDGVQATATFSVESPFPYAIDATQTTTTIGSGSSGTVPIINAGNSDFSPVIKVHGPTSGFTIYNTDDLDPDGNPLGIVYSAALPGAVSIASGHYAEIDCFRGTIFLDGNGPNLVAGIDPANTDYFSIVPGANYLEVTGATIDVLWNNAWV